MQMALKAAGIGGSILVVIALVIALLKNLIAFIGFVTFAIKALVVLAFIAVFVGVAVLVFRSWSSSKRTKEKS
jgi:hypothetical protein